jgi:transcriptional regulator GlxA family with amidase domain
VTEVRDTDLVFMPGIGLDPEAVFAQNPRMLEFLTRQTRRGALIAGVCTGVAVMADSRLLDGRPATTHWALAGEYKKRYPLADCKTELFLRVSDNLFYGGVYASLDICLFLVGARNFTRRFRPANGEAPLDYLHKLRINYAKTLLETEFNTVQQVCFEVGEVCREAS